MTLTDCLQQRIQQELERRRQQIDADSGIVRVELIAWMDRQRPGDVEFRLVSKSGR